MTTIASFTVPVEAAPLSETFARLPSVTCEAEEALATDFPCLWFGGVPRDDLESALEADPSVDSHSPVIVGEEAWLYDIGIAADAADPFALLVAEGGTVLDAGCANGSWSLRTRFSSREGAGRAYDRFRDEGIAADVTRIRDTTGDVGRDFGLTPEQYEALVAAVEHGYFQIPRRVSMQELAEELGISHQALSERLRRAYGTIVTEELNVHPEAEPVARVQRVDGD